MNFTKNQEKGICYSGFRNGQQPGGEYPTYQQIKEDLELLKCDFKNLRLYDVDQHAETVLKVIETEKYSFKLMLGAYIEAEVNNPNCPWGGGNYPEEILQKNKISTTNKIENLIQ